MGAEPFAAGEEPAGVAATPPVVVARAGVAATAKIVKL
jgi:hypothetical protein